MTVNFSLRVYKDKEEIEVYQVQLVWTAVMVQMDREDRQVL